METSKPGTRPLVVAGEPLRQTATLESRAERLVAEYLRVWGVRDPQTIAMLSSHWVRSANDTPNSPRPNASLTELYHAVMRRATGDMEQWLDHLTGEVSAGSDDSRSRRGLLAIELQTIVDQFPAALLEEESLPTPLVQQLASAAWPVVPASCPKHMPTQSLDSRSSSRRLAGWRRAWNLLRQRLQSALPQQAGDQS